MLKVKRAITLVGIISAFGGLTYAGKHITYGFHPEESRISGAPPDSLKIPNQITHAENVQFKNFPAAPALQKPNKLTLRPLDPLEQKKLERKTRQIY